MPYTHENLYFDLSTPFGKDKLLLRHFHGEEAISELFRFDLEMQSETFDLDFKQILGKGVTITVHLADGSDRYIHGVVGSFVQAGRDEVFANYHAEVYPALWLLTMAADCKIFQEKSVPVIIEEVFSDLGLSDYKLDLKGTYKPREYCVQYNESAFTFVSRLMEEEGIFYFFEHEDGKHTLVLADDPSAAKPCAGGEKIEYGTHGVWTQQNVITRCTLGENVISGKAAVDDFNFETPSTDLMASIDSKVALDGAKRRVYEYPGGFLKKDGGDARAKLRIEEYESPEKSLRGDSYCRAFVSGGKFTFEKHYRGDVNAEYILLRVHHSGTWEGYSNSFEAFAADVPYRPPRKTRRPLIPSTQTALVVGKKGEEIWTDKYGRIKVQFHWDQVGKTDEKSSCWIRVAHPWAGKQWGQIFLPRIGQEVVVSFLEGDPDRPLITGSVYNAEQAVPYELPAEQTKSTIKSDSSKGHGGYNELRFEDKKDKEEIYFQAQRDMDRLVKRNDAHTIGYPELKQNATESSNEGDQTIDIKNHRSVKIWEGDETFVVEKGKRTVQVNTGDELHEVKGKRTQNITGAEEHNDKDKFDHNVDKNYTLKVKGDLLIDVKGSVTIKSGKTMTLQSGQSLVAKASQSVTHKAGTSLTNQAGTSLTNKSGTDLTNKAGTNLTNQASIKMDNKASAMQTVDGGGMLTLKGGLVKIN